MRIHKGMWTVLAGLAVMLMLIGLKPAGAAVLEKDGNPIEMVMTEQGGVSLNLQGQEKYFKIWDKQTGSYSRLDIALANIQSYDTDGQRLAYLVNRGSYTDVMLYDLQTKQSRQLTASFTNKRGIKINGDRLAWVDFGVTSGGGIVLYNISSGTSVTIPIETSKNPEVALGSDYMAYLASNGGNTSVYIYDFASAKSMVVRNSSANKASLGISGNRVVWAEGGGAVVPSGSFYNLIWGYSVASNALNEIWLYDRQTGQIKELTDNDVNDVQPTIWGDQLAWVETTGGNPNIVLMNLATGTKQNIAATDLYEVRPALGYGYLAWITMKGSLAELNVESVSGSASGSVTPSSSAIKLMVNGTQYYTDPAPYIVNDRTMVPMRRIFEILGATVSWNESERSVTANQGGVEIKLWIGNTTAYINGRAVVLEAPPEIIAASGRTMVPLRFVSETFGARVGWNDATRTVTIDNNI